MKIAFIGLGNMGGPMALNLHKAGHAVSAFDLSTAACDALRAQGRLDEAATLLAAIADDPTAGNQRALAAFTLARLEIDRRHHPVEAAAAFERAIELGLRAPLLEDARARRVEALSLAGDLAAARVAAETYLTHHPEGRWRTEVERWSAAR